MNTSLYISAGALQAFQQKIDTTGNNIANVDTTGFKRKDQSFSEILANQINNQSTNGNDVGRSTPAGIRVGYGARPGMTQLDMDQGQALETDNPYDLMIQGNGFFQVSYPSATAGGQNEVRFTRDGSFHLSPDPNNPGSNHLVTSDGGYVLDQNGNPVEIGSQYDVKIGTKGQIQLTNKNGQGTAFNSQQRIGLADIQNPHLLKSLGNNEYAIDTTALPNGTTAANYVRAMQPGESQITSGYLEGSNVDLTQEMTDLMTSQRSFQLNSEAVSYADQMMGIANDIMK
ncbi:flagellar hook-basal body protein [Pullulanibacillus sp. KACC 23026]|uniref:flagellar hook-basal body protein n=1 Tax=Pullulanibacillus sp. KACC 23026 TaxID=3028315 RepID=UPI0023B1F973|nr:flagellar hook-basal body protein [Pullulanibacillus sp. KACC 23026]WEG11256.1 flagellar hook-basal body protein [Pullulanibacillus sp. KACC 23026]